MKNIRFLHIADIHLGFKQYGSNERANDIARGLNHAVHMAVGNRVDFVVLSGDLFHKHAIDPHTLYQVIRLLEPLEEARIPLLAIIGNHDSPHQGGEMSWLDYLSATGSIVLLDAQAIDHQLALVPWDNEKRTGSYIDLDCGVRVIGMRYYGASTANVVTAYVQELAKLPPAPYSIMMMHAGLQGEMPFDATAISATQLDPLSPYVDYLALGHYHKPYECDEWIYNPGTLETISIDETEWPDRGMLMVDVDLENKTHKTRLYSHVRRPFSRIQVDASAIPTFADLLVEVSERIDNKKYIATPEGGVIEITLTGLLQFPHAQLDTDAIIARLQQMTDSLLIRVNDKTSTDAGEIEVDENQTRGEVERQVLIELAEHDNYRPPVLFCGMAVNLKESALRNRSPEALADELMSFSREYPLEAAHVN